MDIITGSDISTAIEIEKEFAALKQVERFETWHVLHGGIYSRMICVKAGEAITGALIKIPTTLTISGSMKVLVGDHVYNVDGYEIVAAPANRKQVMYAISDTYVTMSFKTKALTIEDAEACFTDESHRLISRLPDSINHITIGVL